MQPGEPDFPSGARGMPSLTLPKPASRGLGKAALMPEAHKALPIQPLNLNSLFRSILVQKVPCLNIAVRLVEVLVSLLVEGHCDKRHLRAPYEQRGCQAVLSSLPEAVLLPQCLRHHCNLFRRGKSTSIGKTHLGSGVSGAGDGRKII